MFAPWFISSCASNCPIGSSSSPSRSYRKELQVEGDANVRLKGENGLLRKRFDEQLKAIEEGKGALRWGWPAG